MWCFTTLYSTLKVVLDLEEYMVILYSSSVIPAKVKVEHDDASSLALSRVNTCPKNRRNLAPFLGWTHECGMTFGHISSPRQKNFCTASTVYTRSHGEIDCRKSNCFSHSWMTKAFWLARNSKVNWMSFFGQCYTLSVPFFRRFFAG